MKAKVGELTEVVCQRTPDIKKLQLKLQGAVSVQVHAGPLAYAQVFLSRQTMHKWHYNKIGALKEHFRYATSDMCVCSYKEMIACELQMHVSIETASGTQHHGPAHYGLAWHTALHMLVRLFQLFKPRHT